MLRLRAALGKDANALCQQRFGRNFSRQRSWLDIVLFYGRSLLSAGRTGNIAQRMTVTTSSIGTEKSTLRSVACALFVGAMLVKTRRLVIMPLQLVKRWLHG